VLKAEEQRIAARLKTLEHRSERFERFVHDQMVRMNRLSITGEFRNLDVVKNPAKLRITDRTLIPGKFVHIELVPATTVETVLEDEIKATLLGREKALAARDKVIASATKKGVPVPSFEDADLPADIPGAVIEWATRLRIA
jgi:hypothetical protein